MVKEHVRPHSRSENMMIGLPAAIQCFPVYNQALELWFIVAVVAVESSVVVSPRKLAAREAQEAGRVEKLLTLSEVDA